MPVPDVPSSGAERTDTEVAGGTGAGLNFALEDAFGMISGPGHTAVAAEAGTATRAGPSAALRGAGSRLAPTTVAAASARTATPDSARSPRCTPGRALTTDLPDADGSAARAAR